MLSTKREIEFQFEGRISTNPVKQLSQKSILIIQQELNLSLLDSDMLSNYREDLVMALSELSTLNLQEA